MIVQTRCRARTVLFTLFGLPLPLAVPSASADAPAPPPIDQPKIDAAVEKGTAWLTAKLKGGLPGVEKDQKGQSYDEMVLYTLLHAGVSRADPEIVKLVKTIQERPLTHTYTTALRAMAFELYDHDLARADLLNCAQFLVDNQCKNGQWSYGKPVQLPKAIFTVDARKYIATGAAGGSQRGSGLQAATAGTSATAAPSRATAVGSRRRVARRAFSDETGDNSNTQYGMLGLRACMAAGIWPPDDCLRLNEKWYTSNLAPDDGWNYGFLPYGSYGSMTVGGVSSLSISLSEKNQSPVDDPRVKRGIGWLGKHLTFDSNPEGKGYYTQWVYYYIYGLERAGSLAQTETFEGHWWYNEGAKWLIEHQRGDGTWVGPVDRESRVVLDTCWAILFLKRATRHLVFTQEAKSGAPKGP